MLRAFGILLVLAVIAGSAYELRQHQKSTAQAAHKRRFDQDMRAWNECRATVRWQHFPDLLTLCGQIPFDGTDKVRQGLANADRAAGSNMVRRLQYEGDVLY